MAGGWRSGVPGAPIMLGIPASPSWYSAHLACASADGMFFYASDKAVVALDGASGRVIGTRAGKARVNALCAATTSTEDGEGGRGASSSCVDARIKF